MSTPEHATVRKRAETIVQLYQGLPGLSDMLMQQSREAEEQMRRSIRGCVDMAMVAQKYYASMRSHLDDLIKGIHILKSVKAINEEAAAAMKKRPVKKTTQQKARKKA